MIVCERHNHLEDKGVDSQGRFVYSLTHSCPKSLTGFVYTYNDFGINQQFTKYLKDCSGLG